MSETFNLYEAKTHLSKLVERAADGEEIIIAKSGEPKARLVPLQAVREPRKPGALKGKIWISDDFDDPLPDDILRAFMGEDDDDPEDGPDGGPLQSLTLAVDAAMVEKALDYSAENGTSISRLITGFLSNLPVGGQRYGARVERLMGVLPPNVAVSEYHEHLEDKNDR